MKRVIALTLMGALLAGCVSTPTTTPQEKSLAAETLGLGQAPAPQIADRWWTAFGDPQLDALVDRALQGSPTLAAALTRVRTAEAQVSAERALTYPQVTFDSRNSACASARTTSFHRPSAEAGAGSARRRRISPGRWISLASSPHRSRRRATRRRPRRWMRRPRGCCSRAMSRRPISGCRGLTRWSMSPKKQ